jgi:hypothetical protein
LDFHSLENWPLPQAGYPISLYIRTPRTYYFFPAKKVSFVLHPSPLNFFINTNQNKKWQLEDPTAVLLHVTLNHFLKF